jgi:hypothetical protein
MIAQHRATQLFSKEDNTELAISSFKIMITVPGKLYLFLHSAREWASMRPLRSQDSYLTLSSAVVVVVQRAHTTDRVHTTAGRFL